jgi:hypothetical protein
MVKSQAKAEHSKPRQIQVQVQVTSKEAKVEANVG